MIRYRRAAEQGFPVACYTVGRFYESGKIEGGGGEDARRWFMMAAAGGFSRAVEALEALGRMGV